MLRGSDDGGKLYQVLGNMFSSIALKRIDEDKRLRVV